MYSVILLVRVGLCVSTRDGKGECRDATSRYFPPSIQSEPFLWVPGFDVLLQSPNPLTLVRTGGIGAGGAAPVTSFTDFRVGLHSSHSMNPTSDNDEKSKKREDRSRRQNLQL